MRDNRTVVKTYGEPHRGKPVGVLYSDGIYETDRDSRTHFFRKFLGYGISKWILEDLKKNSCAYIDIHEHLSTGHVRVLRTKLETWSSEEAKDFTWNGDAQKVVPVVAMVDEETRRLWSR